jgi:uncharacterized membrane protein YfcA
MHGRMRRGRVLRNLPLQLNLLLDVVTTVIVLLAVGLGAGTLGSMLGVGGGIIMVPALTFMQLPHAQAAATSLFAVTSTSVSSTVAYSRQKRINYKRGVQLAMAAVPGAVLGVFISKGISDTEFKLYFGILLMAVGTYVAFRSSILKEKGQRRMFMLQHLMVFAITFGAGIISSLFGVGGGVIFVPVLLLIYRMTMHQAAATSQLTLLITSVAGILTHALVGNPNYLYAVVLSSGAFVGAQIGAKWSKNTKETLLRKMLGVVLMIVAITFISEGLGIKI